MSGESSTAAMRQLIMHNDRMVGTEPVARKIILEQFLSVRQNTAERVSEKWAASHVNITTMSNYDAEANMICEDVFVESRAPLV